MLSAGFAFAQNWAPLVGTPPTGNTTTGNNTPAPIDVGNTYQIKEGSLATGPLAVFGKTDFFGNVSIWGSTTSTSSEPVLNEGKNSGFLDKLLNKFSFAPYVAYAGHVTYNASTNLTAVYDSSDLSNINVILSWNETSTNESGHSIERKTGTGSFQVVGTAQSNEESYLDFDIFPDTTYSYRVKPHGNHQTPVSYSNVATVQTGDPLPPPLPPASNLYVSGKVGIGIPAPSVALDVSGKVKINSFTNILFTSGIPGTIHTICADFTGKIVSCPGSAIILNSNSQWGNPPTSCGISCNFTVPDGVFRIKIEVGTNSVFTWPGNLVGWPSGTYNVLPGQIFTVKAHSISDGVRIDWLDVYP